jgi:hypothetical protein
VLAFFAQLPECLVGMEACGSAHHSARELIKLGHDARPRSAHLFSIRTNGLSLKPRDRLPPSRLTHRGRLARENFCNLARWRENFFRAPFRARLTCAKSGGYALYRDRSRLKE